MTIYTIFGVQVDLVDHPTGNILSLVQKDVNNTNLFNNIYFKADDIVIDIGAHVGIVSIYLAKAHPHIKIYALEPHPYNFNNLIKNIEINKVKNIIPIQLGVSKDGRDLTLVDTVTWMSTAPSAFRRATINDGVVNIKTITLDKFMKDYSIVHCKLLKMDCEGAEHEVLDTNPDILDKTDYFLLEIHMMNPLKNLGYSREKLERLVNKKMCSDRVFMTYTEDWSV